MRDDAGLDAAVIPPSVLLGLVDLAARHDLNVEPWFGGTGLHAADLTEPDAKVSYRQSTAVIRRALQALPPGPVGMQLAKSDVLVSFGILGFAIRACRTVGEAVEVGVRFHQASGSLADFDLHVDGSEFCIELTERARQPELLPFMSEEAFGASVVLARVIVGPHFNPTRFELAYPRPPYASEYTSFFRCPITFDADACRLVGPTELLDRPVPTGNSAQLALALEAAQRLIDPTDTRPDIVTAVEAVIRRNLRRPLTMAEVADRLYITERTLHRRLAATGQKFSVIRDGVRQQRAAILLRETAQPIAAIAHDIGFSDAREFRRAYQRWTGHPPSADRST